ncbi:hypothetical protein EDEG_03778 [Edhazardia aedis USNM 41457]|uniref:Uncharacterized protein n=1 Tax=Edhazardia aedis (strain USNM 41457) TaxID=1003232 RepID=J8ZPT0_EDHAE|nr:hypothetical protein EDEG_03778 [Edhazardia aedis USNM 41457]|eukprot:EJW01698.1 hypothetical protein EDEG_03778 [Edhazardia aedis USNM 41457]
MPKFNFFRLPTNVFLNITPTTGTKPNPMGKDTSMVKSMFHHTIPQVLGVQGRATVNIYVGTSRSFRCRLGSLIIFRTHVYLNISLFIGTISIRIKFRFNLAPIKYLCLSI